MPVGTGLADLALQSRIAKYDHRLECEIKNLWKNDSPVSSEPHILDGSHTIFLIRPVKNQMFKYVSMWAVQDIATE